MKTLDGSGMARPRAGSGVTAAAGRHREYELIVLDDASSDESRAVLARYAARTPLRLLFNDRNSGSPFTQWTRGADLASGKHVWIAESDDFAESRFLERLLSRLETHPTVGLA